MTDIKRITTKVENKKEEPKGQQAAQIPQPPAGVPYPANMTIEYITGKLFSFHNTAHFYHFQTTSHAQHKALEHLYERLVHLKDEIPEFLLALQSPKRFAFIVLDDIKSYSDTELLSFLDEGMSFGKSLCNFATGKDLEALDDMGGEVCKAFAHCKLLISYT
jgi:hypothetical protein